MLEALDGARVAPLHRRDGHARQRHIQVEARAQPEGDGHAEGWHELAPQLAARVDEQRARHDDGGEADDHERLHIGEVEPGVRDALHAAKGHQHPDAGQHEDYYVAEEHVAPQLRVPREHGDLQAQHRHEQRLVVRETNAQPERRPPDVARLVRRVHPAHDRDEH